MVVIMAAVSALLLIAGLRQQMERLVHAGIGVPAGITRAIIAGTDAAIDAVHRAMSRMSTQLAYRSPAPTIARIDAPAETTSAGAYDVLAPLLSAIAALVLFAGDLALAAARFSALLGVGDGSLPISGTVLDIGCGLLLVVATATLGACWFELEHVMPVRRPFGCAPAAARRWLRPMAICGVALSAAATTLFLVWGQTAISGKPNSRMALVFVALFALALFLATIVAAAGALAAPIALGYLATLGVRLPLYITRWQLRWTHEALDRGYRVGVHLVRLAARPGHVMWNWLTSFSAVEQRLHLHPLPEATDLLPLDDEPSATHAFQDFADEGSAVAA
jgi:hypothetical protein